jgi:hypothetical protein
MRDQFHKIKDKVTETRKKIVVQKRTMQLMVSRFFIILKASCSLLKDANKFLTADLKLLKNQEKLKGFLYSSLLLTR